MRCVATAPSLNAALALDSTPVLCGSVCAHTRPAEARVQDMSAPLTDGLQQRHNSVPSRSWIGKSVVCVPSQCVSAAARVIL